MNMISDASMTIEAIRELIPEYQEVKEQDTFDNQYTPLKWATVMHTDPAFIKFVIGSFGSGKSRAVGEEFYALALEYPGSEWLVSRWTLPDLKETAMKTMLSIIPTRMIKWFNKTDKKLCLINDSKFLFRSLKDDIDNPEKLKSYEYNGAWIEEASEIEKSIAQMVVQRARKKLRGPYRNCVVFTFNPTDEKHWLYEACVTKPWPGSKVFKSKTIDNIHNLPPNYIEQLKSIYPKEQWAQVLEGEFGSIKTEMGIFSSEFNFALHCKPLQYDPGLVMRRSWDWGFNHPSCYVFQVTPQGQHRSLKEFFGDHIFLDRFAKNCLDACSEMFPGMHFIDYGDPRGNDKKDDGKPSIQLMREEFGIVIHSKRTEIMDGIKIMRKKLTTLTNGEPEWVIDPDKCPMLKAGLGGGYKMDPKNDNKPLKEGHFEHIFDAVRYGFVNTSMVDMKLVNKLKKRYYNPKENMNIYNENMRRFSR